MAPIAQFASVALFFSSGLAFPLAGQEKQRVQSSRPRQSGQAWTLTVPFIPTGTAPVPPTGTGGLLGKRHQWSGAHPTGTGRPWPVSTGGPPGFLNSRSSNAGPKAGKFGGARRADWKPSWGVSGGEAYAPAPSSSRPGPTATAPVPIPTGTIW